MLPTFFEGMPQTPLVRALQHSVHIIVSPHSIKKSLAFLNSKLAMYATCIIHILTVHIATFL